MSNMMGLMLVVPLLAAIYAIIIAVSALRGTTPVILTAVQGIIWYIMIGAAAVAMLMAGIGFVLGAKSKPAKTA
jgi:hypothetical protein